MNWLPENYEAPASNNIYFRPQAGTSKIRILGDFRHAHTAIMLITPHGDLELVNNTPTLNVIAAHNPSWGFGT